MENIVILLGKYIFCGQGLRAFTQWLPSSLLFSYWIYCFPLVWSDVSINQGGRQRHGEVGKYPENAGCVHLDHVTERETGAVFLFAQGFS